MRHIRMRMAVSVALASVALVVAACGSDNNDSSSSSSSGSSSSGPSEKIALLLPESKTARYEAQDRPLFEAKMKALCPNCKIIYSNADQDASKQQTAGRGGHHQRREGHRARPGRLGLGRGDRQPGQAVEDPGHLLRPADHRRRVDYYISFDNEQVGKLQGRRAAQGARDGPNGKPIVMINGAPTDNNAKLFKQGAHSVLDKSGVKIAKEYDTPDWSPTRPSRRWSRRSPRSARTTSTASTPPTTAPPAARSRR